MTEAAGALLDYGFEERKLGEIVAIAVATNTRSIAVMKRIGMYCDPSRGFEHSGVPDTHPQLRPHVLYAITADRRQRNGEAAKR